MNNKRSSSSASSSENGISRRSTAINGNNTAYLKTPAKTIKKTDFSTPAGLHKV